MHPEKVAFLFGESADGADPDDLDDRVELISRQVSEDHLGAGAPVALRAAVADQTAQDKPPQVWRTAQRLLADGRDRTAVMPSATATARRGHRTPMPRAGLQGRPSPGAATGSPIDSDGETYSALTRATVSDRLSRVDEHATGAVARADAMLRSPVTPWCSTWL